jgi:hypothetical protein
LQHGDPPDPSLHRAGNARRESATSQTLENFHSGLRTRKLRVPGSSSTIRIDVSASHGSLIRDRPTSLVFPCCAPPHRISLDLPAFFDRIRASAARTGSMIITEQGCSGQSPRQESLKIVTSSRLESLKSCLVMRHENAIDVNLKSSDLKLE